ncbi:MAG: DUF1439 domain-containing protein [Burkholderiales bacterium]|nr:DUF1439 domain-containing protein [Burkholderiales bacterium]
MRCHNAQPAFAGLLLIAIALATACTHLGLQQREVFVSADKLSEALAKRLSIERKLLDVFTVRIAQPKVTLEPGSQRLRVDFDLSLGHPFSTRPMSGRAGISGALGYDAASRSVMLLEPKVERFEIEGTPPAVRDPLGRLGAALGAELLGKYPLLTLQPRDLTAYGREYRVLGFEVLEKGIQVVLRAKD